MLNLHEKTDYTAPKAKREYAVMKVDLKTAVFALSVAFSLLAGAGILALIYQGMSEADSHTQRALSEDVPDFGVNLKDKFTTDPESQNIREFEADSPDASWATCQKDMPETDTTTGGGMEPACIQYEPGKYSCICMLKLHKKHEKPFKEYVFYLKKQEHE